MITRNRRNQRGASLVFLTVSLVGICGVAGLSVDEGMMWYARNKAQTVADSAAIAWATQNSSAARDRVIAAYSRNGVTFNRDDAQTTSTRTSFTVRGTVRAPAVFGGVVGHGYTLVPARATVTLTAATKVNNAVPWGIVADQPNPDSSLDASLRSDLIFINSLLTNPPANFTYQTRQITLKSISMSGTTINAMGDFGELNLIGSSGGADYRTNVGYNSSQTISIGDTLTTLTGNKVGPTGQGMSDRLSTSLTPPNYMDQYYVNSSQPYDDWFYGRSTYPQTGTDPITGHAIYSGDPGYQDVNDDHVAVVPLISTPGKNGTSDVTVLGFGVFFIEDTNPNGNSQYVVTGRFIGMNIPGFGGGDSTHEGGAMVVTMSD